MILLLLSFDWHQAHADERPALDSKPIAFLWTIPGRVDIDKPSCQAVKKIRMLLPFMATDCPVSDVGVEPHVRIDTVGVTGEQLIAEFLRQDPRYAAIVDEDWVVVMPAYAVGDPAYPLNTRVDHVSVKDKTLYELMSAIHLRVKQTTGRDLYFLPNNPNSRQAVTLDLSSRTVRSILLDAAIAYSASLEFVVGRNGFQFFQNGFGGEIRGDRLIDDWDSLIETNALPQRIREILERRRQQGLRNSQRETLLWERKRK